MRTKNLAKSALCRLLDAGNHPEGASIVSSVGGSARQPVRPLSVPAGSYPDGARVRLLPRQVARPRTQGIRTPSMERTSITSRCERGVTVERNGWASPGKAHPECSAMLEGCSRLRAGGARLEPVDMGVAAPGEPKGVRRVRASESPGSLLDVPPVLRVRRIAFRRIRP